MRRAGVPCPKCGGQVMRLGHEDVRCIMCAWEPRTLRELEAMTIVAKTAGVRNAEPRFGKLRL